MHAKTAIFTNFEISKAKARPAEEKIWYETQFSPLTRMKQKIIYSTSYKGSWIGGDIEITQPYRAQYSESWRSHALLIEAMETDETI